MGFVALRLSIKIAMLHLGEPSAILFSLFQQGMLFVKYGECVIIYRGKCIDSKNTMHTT